MTRKKPKRPAREPQFKPTPRAVKWAIRELRHAVLPPNISHREIAEVLALLERYA